ncbi:MAG: DUF4395 domain-containing protein [Deltaproteobacteria bacterium]|nr:DUF4395 domain-containing protein [Deltaproteobacteria bacterium]
MKVTDRPIHAAPKLFAAKIGFVFSVAIAVMWYTGAGAAAIAAASLLASFAALEAFAEICVGCWMYSLLQMLIRRGAVNPRPMAG